jgi:hypothetical protein
MLILVSVLYAERLGRSANSFDELYEALQQDPTIDSVLLSTLKEKSKQFNLHCFFIGALSGNLYSAFRSAQWVKKHHPN